MISFLKSKAEPRGFSLTFFSSRMNPSRFRLATTVFGVNARGRDFSADVGRPIPEGRRRAPAN